MYNNDVTIRYAAGSHVKNVLSKHDVISGRFVLTLILLLWILNKKQYSSDGTARMLSFIAIHFDIRLFHRSMSVRAKLMIIQTFDKASGDNQLPELTFAKIMGREGFVNALVFYLLSDLFLKMRFCNVLCLGVITQEITWNTSPFRIINAEHIHIDVLVQDCSTSIANAIDIGM